MPPESMVNALTKIRKLLKPDGYLIDIHPQDTKLPIYVQVGSDKYPVGEIDVESKFAKYRRADTALETVIKQGLYRVKKQAVVDFLIYFDSVIECRQYLEQEWSNALLSESSWAQMKLLMNQKSDFKQIFYSEGVKFCRLTPNFSD